jgi:hypothetical protein
MFAAHRLLGLGVFCTAALYGCGSSSYSSESGTMAVAAGTTGSGMTSGAATGGFTSAPSSINGTHDTVVATAQSNLVSVEVGAKQNVSITFNSSDGRTITGLALSSGSGVSLPAGWTGPTTFGCATLSTGSGCVLNLTFTPTLYETGQSFTLDYVYVDNSTEPQVNGSVTVAYQATTNDNVIPTLSSAGAQVNATVNSGSQTVTATFATDDAHPASAFAITSDPSMLPPGWVAPSASSCATVSAGTACQLAWVYAPTAPGNGTITIDYSFADDSGTPKTASFNIPYAATANDNVIPSAAGPITAAVGTSQVVTVVFSTDDGFQASNLSMDLSALSSAFPGWSDAATTFTCSTIGTGGGCTLSLTFAPSCACQSGTLSLPYTYADNAGTMKPGMVSIVYSST